MKIFSLLFSLVFSTCIFAQVGVGTTTPDPSSILDITAADKGVLVPRVNLIDVADTTAPINAPATGLLIWNTNASVTGGNGEGFYFFNGAQWVAIQQAQVDDADFYEEGTTTAPNDITDDMYTQGNVGIGQVTADYKLDITEDTGLKAVDITVTGDIDGNRIAIDNNISGTQNPGIGNIIRGLRNEITAGGGFAIRGVENRLIGNNSSQKYGVLNTISGGASNHYGVSNFLSGSDATGGNLRYGVYNELNYNDSGNERGVFNLLTGSSTGSKTAVFNVLSYTSNSTGYGIYNNITASGNGIQYGLRSDFEGIGSGNKYGMYNFMSHSNLVSELVGVFNVIGSDAANTEARTGFRTNFESGASSSGPEYGLYNLFNSSSTGTKYGVYNLFASIPTSGNSDVYGSYNLIAEDGDGNHYGTYNLLEGNGTGAKYGSYNTISTIAGGTHYGVYSNVLKSGSFAGYFLGDVSIGTTVGNSYVMPDSDGTTGQIMQTDGAGNVDWVDKNDNSALSLVRVNLSGTYNQSATGATWVNIDFDNEIFDTNGEFNTTTNTFTAASAGYYRVNASYHTTAQSNTGYFGIAVYVNGTLYAESTHNHHNVGDVMRQVNCLVALAVSDTVELRIRAESNAVDIDGFGGKTFMEIEQIKRN
ncbi:hypothetical protein ACPX19_10080 [Winogradskyella sp. HB-48]|uniref:hypothetical protein n=1 Tax=Winogradskyella sp. HB-48 TaxID=3416808 RepID=UPI003CFABB08